MSRNNLGDQIRHTVEEAMNSKNFSQLNAQIKNSVNGAIEEVRKAVGPYQQPEERRYSHNNYSHRNHSHGSRSHRRENDTASNTHWQTVKPIKPVKPVGSVAGMVFFVLGIIFSILFGLGALVTYLVAYFTQIFFVLGPVSTTLFILFLGSTLMLAKGISMRRRVKRYYQYQRLLRGRSFCAIQEFSEYLGKSKYFIINDIKKMIRLGYYPEGHIDKQKTHFMISNEVYDQYLASVRNYEERKQRKVEKQPSQQESKDTNESNQETASAINQAVKVGREYIEEIRRANDVILEELISNKLDRLEHITTRIFVYVEKNPEKLPEIRRFMEYYLPTTLKLVKAYKEFDSQTIQGENIKTAKTEIQNTLDTINDAFEKLLDSLFEDAAMEVSTDISVLQTLLAQEGLTKSDFKRGGN